jgi:ABC-type nitrate/sulfonate/bicarbonate transport system substrate-binding protein
VSFQHSDIAEEIAAARGDRVEFFDGDAYSFRRLPKVGGLDRKFVKLLMNARWRKAHPEAVRAYWRAWRAANPERARAYVNRYAKTAKGRAVGKAKKLRWQQKHRDAYNAAQRAAYARRLAAGQFQRGHT